MRNGYVPEFVPYLSQRRAPAQSKPAKFQQRRQLIANKLSALRS